MVQKDWKNKIIFLGPIILLIILGTFSGYYYLQYKKTKDLLANPNELSKTQNKKVIQLVSKLIELPKEEPTVAEVLDKTKLQDQTFFKSAENGDKVLIFAKSKKAILYRPSQNKIIEVSIVNIGIDSPTPTETAISPTKTLLNVTPIPTTSL